MHLSEETWRKAKLDTQIKFITVADNMFPPCLKYAGPLYDLAKKKNIDVLFKHNVKRINKDRKTITLVNLDTKEESEESYDFLHFIAP